jgi:hypothetical protein
MRHFFAALICLFLAAPAAAEAPTPQEQAAFQAIIDGQLKAFAADNGPGAYEFAAPMIKGMFPDPEMFMSMVKRGYEPVYRNQSYAFGEAFEDPMGRPAQRVIITAMDGKRYEAVYTMQLQGDGTWKIAGCYLVKVPELDA